MLRDKLRQYRCGHESSRRRRVTVTSETLHRVDDALVYDVEYREERYCSRCDATIDATPRKTDRYWIATRRENIEGGGIPPIGTTSYEDWQRDAE